jgi:nucleotide-binding universal stress UspA family protein
MIVKPEIKKILFATDLSENADHAFSYAAVMAEAFDAQVTVLHVIEKLRPNAELLMASILGYSDTEELRHDSEMEMIERIKVRLDRFCSAAVDQFPGCRFKLKQAIVEPGNAAERILHHVETGAYDTLVMGSRGHGLLKESLMGGTSRKVVLSSTIPVLVIPLRRPVDPIKSAPAR